VDLALRLFAVCVAALQFLVAAVVLRKPAGPFRYGLAILLALNGMAALRLAALGTSPSLVDRWMLPVDGATGPMLLACGILLWRFPDHDRRDRLGFGVLWGGTAIAALLLALAATDWSYRHLFPPAYDWLHTLPATIGLVLAGLALARALARSLADRAPEAALVGLGFLPTMAENGSWAFDHLYGFFLRDAATSAARFAGQAALVLAVPVALALLLWPGGRNRAWRHILAIVTVASGIAYFAFWNVPAPPDSPEYFAIYLGTTVSFYVLRPLGVGLAYSRSKTLLGLYDVACLALVLVAGKAFAVVVLGTDPAGIEFADLTGISLALLLFPLLLWIPRRLLRLRTESLDRPSSDELLGRFLLDHYRRHGPDAMVAKQDIEAATGITENNLAATIRRLERRLDPKAEPGTFVAERRVGVRGQKRYRLTAQGLRLLGPRPPPRRPSI
jgi:hypothetical protein